MSTSHHPAPVSTHLLPPPMEFGEDDEVGWGEESAVFELHSARREQLPAVMPAVMPAAVMPAVIESQSPPLPDDLGQIFSEHRSYVAKIGRRILGASAEVDDLIQDVFLTTVKGAHQIKDPGRLRAWLGTVTTRMAKRRRFRRAAQPISGEDVHDLVDLASEEGPGPESTADLSGNVRKLLSLPDELRTPWLLKHVEGRTLEDVAKQCDCSLSTAARRIQMASGKINRKR